MSDTDVSFDDEDVISTVGTVSNVVALLVRSS